MDYDGTNHPGAAKRRPRHVLRPPTNPARPTKNKDWSATYGTSWDDSDGNPALYERFLGTAVAHAIAPDAAMYVWHASRRQVMLEAAMVKAGALVHAQIVWVKNRPVLTRTWYAWKHEPCFMGWLKGNKPPRVDKAVLSTVWAVDPCPTGRSGPITPLPSR